MISTELSGILSEFGLPVWAGAFAYGLVRGADALEEDANEERLKYISALLKDRSFVSYGKLGASVVPFIFDKVFGSNPFSIKFIFRSILASCAFWLLLVFISHPSYSGLLFDLIWGKTWQFLVIVLFVDWLSLSKAKAILTFISRRDNIFWTLGFVIIDISSTLIILIICVSVLAVIFIAPWERHEFLNSWAMLHVMEGFFLELGIQMKDYFSGKLISLLQVAVASTMLTSAWVVLFFISTLLLKILFPLEYIRRFTLWWFKDIDAHPLRAIAKVSAILIIIVAFTIKLARWGWLLV